MTSTSSSPIVRFEIGRVLLQKYRVEHVLGEGGMGVVLGVRHTDLNVLFAMKLLLPEAVERAAAVERFLSEARAAARIVNDHVAHVYDVGKLEDGSPYMLMEHLEGVDLSTLLESEGAVAACDAIDYVLQALEAIGEAHAIGIIHRDLKPANLFLAKRPTGHSMVKVLDFGISQDIDRKGPSLTHSGSLVGTPYYMSPEQMRSQKELDVRVDIWALGVVLYELLTDSVPFPGASVTEVCSHVLEGEPIPLSVKAPATPPGLVRIVERCLKRKPEERYQSAAELAVALRTLREDLGDPPGVLRPRAPLDSFTGPSLELVRRSLGSTSLDSGDDEDQRQTAPVPSVEPTSSELAPTSSAAASNADVSNADTSNADASPMSEPVPPSSSVGRTEGRLTHSELASSVHISKLPGSSTITGWSDANARRGSKGHLVLGVALASPIVLVALLFSMKAIFAASPGHQTATAFDADNARSPLGMVATAAPPPSASDAPNEPAADPKARPTVSAMVPSAAVSTPKPFVKPTNTAPAPAPVRSAGPPAKVTQAAPTRRHEGIY